MFRQENKNIVFSASDLVTFPGCRHATFLERLRIEGIVQTPEEAEDPYLELLKNKGSEHERKHREVLCT